MDKVTADVTTLYFEVKKGNQGIEQNQFETSSETLQLLGIDPSRKVYRTKKPLQQ